MLIRRERTLSDFRIVSLSVTTGASGWDVREEHDGKLVRSINCTDWHRVERRLRQFDEAAAHAEHTLELDAGASAR